MRACPGCGLWLTPRVGPTHAYIGASPECWAVFGLLLEKDYARYDRASHALTVDTYAVQHPGRPEPRSVRSVCFHLARLYMVLERGLDTARAPRPDLPDVWLDPPTPNGALTVADVVSGGASVEEWAADVWAAWEPHHETVNSWLDWSGAGCA